MNSEYCLFFSQIINFVSLKLLWDERMTINRAFDTKYVTFEPAKLENSILTQVFKFENLFILIS